MSARAPLDVVALGKLLRLWRLNAGLTQAKLAKRIGTSGPAVGAVERGVYGSAAWGLRIDKLLRWARACNADPCQALELVDASMFGSGHRVELDDDEGEAACG